MALRSNVWKLRDVLLEARVIDEFQMRSAMSHLEQWGGRLPGVIVEMGFCDDEMMTKALSTALKLPIARLGMVQKDASLLARVGIDYCAEHALFPISLQNRVAVIAMSDPTELDTIDALSSKLNARINLMVGSELEIRAAIDKHYRGNANSSPHHEAWSRNAHIEATSGTVFDFNPHTPAEMPALNPLASQEWLKKEPSANTLLDEFLDPASAGGKVDGFTADEIKRLEGIRENQQRTGLVLEAVRQLLSEKGYL